MTKNDWIAQDRDLDADYTGPRRNSKSTGRYYWNGYYPFYFPGSSTNLALTGVPTYYGLKDRSDGVKISMSDLAPIVWELKNLNWVTSYNYADFENALADDQAHNPLSFNEQWAHGDIPQGKHVGGDPQFPFSIASEKVYTSSSDPNIYHFNGYAQSWKSSNPYNAGDWVKDAQGLYWRCLQNVSAGSPSPSAGLFWAQNGTGEFRFKTNGEIDDLTTSLYNIGIFYDPNDPGAFYTTIANRRTWPMLLNWETHDQSPNGNPTQFRTIDSSVELPTQAQTPLLGAIDARRVDLTLKTNSTNGGAAWQDYTGTSINWPNPQSGSPVDWYTFTNLRTGWDTTASTTTTSPNPICIDLDPGEGTLVRIAPATALILGRTNYMAYNNSHRVAEYHSTQIPTPGQRMNGQLVCVIPPVQRATCWESNGSIQFSRQPPEGLQDGEFNSEFTHAIVYSPTANDHSTDAHNPAIACKPVYIGTLQGTNDTIGIVFSVDDFPAERPGTRQVMFAGSTNGGTSWQTITISPAGLLYNTRGVPDVTGVMSDGITYSDLLVPSISAGSDGFFGAYTTCTDQNNLTFEGLTFWVQFVNGSWQSAPIPGLSTLRVPGQLSQQVRFATVATRDEIPAHTPTEINGQSLYSEIIHFAWEDDVPSGSGGTMSGIYYQAIEHTWPPGGGDEFTPGKVVPVSDGYPLQHPALMGSAQNGQTVFAPNPACPHHHPMITVIAPPTVGGYGMPAVTWEVTDEEGVLSSPIPSNNWEYVTGPTYPVEREATSFANLIPTWSASFLTVQTPLVNNQYEVNNLPQPVLRVEDNVCPMPIPPSMTTNLRELDYQDTFARQTFIYRKNKVVDNRTAWSPSRITEYAQTPSVSLPYDADPSEAQDAGSIAYRETYADENGLYAQMLTANPPNDETAIGKSLIQYLAASSSNSPACAPPVVNIGIGVHGEPCNTCGGSIVDTMPPPPPIVWNFNAIGNFTAEPINDSMTTLVQTSWPQTEDSITTNYFSTLTPDTIYVERNLEIDTTQIAALLPDVSHYLSYKLVVKDSVSQTVTQVLDSVIIHGGLATGSYPGIDPLDSTSNGISYRLNAIVAPTPSGSAYLTILYTKDNLTQAELVQNQQYADSLPMPILDTFTDSNGGGGFKKLAPHTQSMSDTAQLTVTVHPNPTKGIVKICVEDIPGGIPASVDVVSQLGTQVAMLYNGTQEAESGLCLSLDCSNIPAGIYYADLQTMGMHKAVKFTVEH